MHGGGAGGNDEEHRGVLVHGDRALNVMVGVVYGMSECVACVCMYVVYMLECVRRTE